MKINELIKPANLSYEDMARLKALVPCADSVMAFFSDLSASILKDGEYRQYPDIAAFAFFVRKANILKMKAELLDTNVRLGRGLAFHIAPSNVPVNFAYSLAAGLLSGNANIIKVSSKDFPQVRLLCRTICGALEKDEHRFLADYIAVIQYDNDDGINDFFSSLCHTRLIWGGDETIARIRKSPLPPRSLDITFANRYSVCVIDAAAYNESGDKEKIAKNFYADTYGFDQNACFSPRLVYWMGGAEQVAQAKAAFWQHLHDYAKPLYRLEESAVSEKYMTACRVTLLNPNIKIEKMPDNLIVRCSAAELSEDILDGTCSSGFFIEYEDPNLNGLKCVSSKKIQTLSYYGFSSDELSGFVTAEGLHGIDRITSIGKANEFSLVWDGINLLTTLSRVVLL
ncbi:MAG: hypothetical protein FWB80_10480 [Defluviitaleaceae bacterium]|nr:hypothetical protein [Defluviitaleaceae bacterium]